MLIIFPFFPLLSLAFSLRQQATRKVSKRGYLFVAPDWDFSNPLYRTKVSYEPRLSEGGVDGNWIVISTGVFAFLSYFYLHPRQNVPQTTDGFHFSIYGNLFLLFFLFFIPNLCLTFNANGLFRSAWNMLIPAQWENPGFSPVGQERGN